jgi:hypothetical protein
MCCIVRSPFSIGFSPSVCDRVRLGVDSDTEMHRDLGVRSPGRAIAAVPAFTLNLECEINEGTAKTFERDELHD